MIALCIDTTCCSVVAVDAEGTPLRPAMIWMDVRSAAEAADVAASGDPARRINSDGRGPVSAEWTIPKSLWMKRNQPELFSQAARICEYQGYINWRLTGRWIARSTTRRCAGTIRAAKAVCRCRCWGSSILPSSNKWPPLIVRPADVIDSLTESAAEHLGLESGIPVAQGGADAFIA